MTTKMPKQVNDTNMKNAICDNLGIENRNEKVIVNEVVTIKVGRHTWEFEKIDSECWLITKAPIGDLVVGEMIVLQS